MAYAKNKAGGRGGSKAFTIKNSRGSVKKRRRIKRAQKFNRQMLDSSRGIILSVIVLSGLVVTLSALYTAIATPEYLVKSKFESIVADYYENYFYDNLLQYAATNHALEDIMPPYAEHGFSRVTLEQLLLFDGRRHATTAGALLDRCDDHATYVVIYPDAPYSSTDYHVDYSYACEF